MPLFSLTGSAKPVKDALLNRVRLAHKAGDHDILLIVPAQYTLQAEMEVLEEGSLRLQVLSPGRLFARIFDSAGWPGGARIDEQGRVMLVHTHAARLKKQLRWYHRAVGRRGFAEKALMQISGFKQARKQPQDVRDMAESREDGALKLKLFDLALIYEAYEEAIAGRFVDGEDEARMAVERIAGAAFAEGAEVFVYGFDIISQPLAEVLCALAGTARHVTVAMTISQNPHDKDLYVPVVHSRDRLLRLAGEAGIDIKQIHVHAPENRAAPDIAHLARELFCVPRDVYHDAPKAVQLAALKSPQDEAEFAAALVRQLVMDRGWRWRDVAVMAQNLDDDYSSALRRAFARAEVPLFLPTSRPADRHPAAQCLLAALRLISRGWRTEDFVLYLRSGFTGLDDDALDRLINHVLRRGLRGKSLKNPLRMLTEDQGDLETWREHAASPLVALEGALKGQHDARAVLTQVFEFIDGLDMCGQLERMADALTEMAQPEWAMEGAQVYTRILAAMDQMAELMDGEKLTLETLSQMMERALAVAEIKPLPQSGDAVVCGSADHMKSQDVKALLMLGLTDQAAPTDAGLITERELGQIGEKDLSASLNAMDRQRMTRLSVKSALSFTERYLLLSHPMSGPKGEAVKPGILIGQVKRILTGLVEKGGQVVTSDERRMRYMRLNAPVSAMVRLPAMLSETPRDPYLIAVRDALGGDDAGEHIREVNVLPGALAARLFDQIDEVSVTRLERYARCPYQHFVHYALRPEEFREFELTPRDAGTFYHAAMEQFLRDNSGRLQLLSEAESMAEMDIVTAPMMDELIAKSLGEGAVAKAQGEDLRGVARRAAATVAHHLRGSEFGPLGLEIDFGQREPQIKLDGGAHLGGRIDRVDAFADGENTHVRVIDYKTGGKALELSEVYYGLQMQLMVYLAAAAKQAGGVPAGALYFNISDKIVDVDSTDPQIVEAERKKALRLKGVLVDDEHIIRAMSDHPKDVIQTRGDGTVSADDLALMMNHTLKKARSAYKDLRGGVIARRPANTGGELACDYCDYVSVCPRNPGEPVAKLPKLKGAEALALMRSDEENA